MREREKEREGWGGGAEGCKKSERMTERRNRHIKSERDRDKSVRDIVTERDIEKES